MSTEPQLNEQFFFFPSGCLDLYASIHEPAGMKCETGVVLCGPFVTEAFKVYRILFNLCRYVAKRGYQVLRFDYGGTGDSSGLFEEANVATYTQNVVDAVELVNRYGAKKVVILACRLGAVWSLLAASNPSVTRLDRIVLWDPVLDLKAYLYNQLRGNLSEQTIYYGKVIENRDRLVERILSGETVNVAGYPITRTFFEQACQLSLFKYSVSLKANISLVLRDDVGSTRTSALVESLRSFDPSFHVGRVRRVPAEFDWEISKGYMTNPVRVFDTMVEAIAAE